MARKIKQVITVYSFKELLRLERRNKVRPKVMERVREWLRESATDHDWWEYVTDEMWQPALEQIGFTNPKIGFSGFWSQGDGASFTAGVDFPVLVEFLANPPEANESIGSMPDGKGEDFRPWLVHHIGGLNAQPKFRKLIRLYESGHIDEVTVRRISHRYSHQYTCEFSANWHFGDSHPKVYQLFVEFRACMEDVRLDLCHAIYKSLEDEYEYLTSDEAYVESSEANDWGFTLDGSHESLEPPPVSASRRPRGGDAAGPIAAAS